MKQLNSADPAQNLPVLNASPIDVELPGPSARTTISIDATAGTVTVTYTVNDHVNPTIPETNIIDCSYCNQGTILHGIAKKVTLTPAGLGGPTNYAIHGAEL